MAAENSEHASAAAATGTEDDFLSSNSIRLSMSEWAIVAVIVISLVIGLPRIWSQVEVFDPGADYRIPRKNSDDYWLYQRFVQTELERNHLLLIGDSVVWGQYVHVDDTLTHFLNENQDEVVFANGGLRGSHPLALEGLVSDYTDGLTGKPVVLHCNLLWMSAPERDLSIDEDVSFNHPRLIPQFIPWVPAYQAPTNERLGVIFGRNVALRSCVRHLNITDFDSLTPYAWSLEHPYENPLSRISLATPQPSNVLEQNPITWIERGITPRGFPWVPLESSLQWGAFRRTVELLRDRGNRVFVILGPFNAHLLTDESRGTYQQLKSGVELWFQENGIPYAAPPLLPSEEYADASHPLSAGYQRMAEAILDDDRFVEWLAETRSSE